MWFCEGNLNYFAYAGQNGYKYQSVGRLLVEDGEIPKRNVYSGYSGVGQQIHPAPKVY